jgi:hypothetical protein
VQAAGQGAGWLEVVISCSQPGVPSSLVIDAAVCSAVAALLASELEEAALSQADLARFVAQPGWEGEEVAGLVARVKALAAVAALSVSRRVTLLRRLNALLLPRVVAPAGVADKPAAPLAAVAPGELHKCGKPACARNSAGLRGFSSSANLLRHVRVSHSTQRRDSLSCDALGCRSAQPFARRDGLYEHVKLLATREAAAATSPEAAVNSPRSRISCQRPAAAAVDV